MAPWCDGPRFRSQLPYPPLQNEERWLAHEKMPKTGVSVVEGLNLAETDRTEG